MDLKEKQKAIKADFDKLASQAKQLTAQLNETNRKLTELNGIYNFLETEIKNGEKKEVETKK